MKILGVEERSYLNNRANEENFPSKIKNAVIHLATHNDFITKGNLKIPAIVMSKTNNSDIGTLIFLKLQREIIKIQKFYYQHVLRIVHIQPIKIVFPDL